MRYICVCVQLDCTLILFDSVILYHHQKAQIFYFLASSGHRKPRCLETFLFHFHMRVSKNRGTPKSSILIGVSLINHPFWGTPIFGNTHVLSVQKVLLGPTPRSSESHTCCSWCASWPSPKPKTSLEAALDDWNSCGNHAKIRQNNTAMKKTQNTYIEVPWSTGFPSANSAFNQYLSIAYPLWHTIEDGLASVKIEPLNRKMTPFQHSSKQSLFIAKMLLAKQAGRITGPLPSLNIVAPENRPSQKDISSSNHQFSGAMLYVNI